VISLTSGAASIATTPASCFSADERSELGWQSGRRSQAAQWRKAVPDPLYGQLEQVLWDGQVFELVLAEVVQPGPVWQRTGDQPAGGIGEHHLPAVRHPSDPGGAVHVHPDVAVAVGDRFAGVQAHPDAYLLVARPLVGGQSALCVDRCGRRVAGTFEDDEEAVALGAHLIAT
jgi:hypothetical protein